MTLKKREIPLHDRSRVHVSRTDSGALYVETYGPGTLKDGHGVVLQSWALLTEADISALVTLRTEGTVCTGTTTGATREVK